MGDDDDEMGVAPTGLAPSAEPTEAVNAWSLDDSEELSPPRLLTPGRITALAIAGAAVLVAAAGALAVVYLRQPASSPSTAQPTITVVATPTTTPASPPPITITSTVRVAVPDARTAEPTLPPATWSKADDARFIAALQADNWMIWDAVQLAESAHIVCAHLQRGYTPLQVVMSLTTIPTTEAWSFVNAAQRSYPNCP